MVVEHTQFVGPVVLVVEQHTLVVVRHPLVLHTFVAVEKDQRSRLVVGLGPSVLWFFF